MPVRYDLLHLMPDYLRRLDSLIKQSPRLREKMADILRKYGQDCSLLQRSPLNGAKKRVFHVRVDGEKRLIDEPLEGKRAAECAILMVGHHDEANMYGENYSSDTLAIIERGKSRTIVARARTHPPTPAISSKQYSTHARIKGSYGEYLKVRQLLRLGLPEAKARMVLSQSTSVGLSALGLSSEICTTIENLFRAKQPMSPVFIPVPGLEPIESIEMAPSQASVLLRVPLARLLATMTEEQRNLAYRENRRLYIVRGAAGSGKTVIGVRRIEHLLAQRELFDKRPLLFTCYNRVLRSVADQMISETIGRSTKEAQVEVRTIYQVLNQLAGEWGVHDGAKRLSPEKLVPIIRGIRPSDPRVRPLNSWTDEEVLGEIREVIFGRALLRLSDYLAADRSGRGKALNEASRRAIWKIYKEFREKCGSMKPPVITWEHLAASLLQHIEKRPPREARYSGIVIDEVQDLMPAAIRTLIGIQGGQTDNILILGDAAQNVYHSGFRWKNLGLSVAGGQVQTIRKSFRSTDPIVRAATPLLISQRESLGEDLVVPEALSGEHAPQVQVRKFLPPQSELEQVALDVAALVEEGVPPSSIAVLIDARGREQLKRYLDDLDCATEDYQKRMVGMKSINVSEQSVKLLTSQSAKGLEFQYLFIPQVTETRFPSRDSTQTRTDRARRELYTAMMRCAWGLSLSAVEGRESGLLAELDLSGHVHSGPNNS